MTANQGDANKIVGTINTIFSLLSSVKNLILLGSVEEAMKDLRKALEINPEFEAAVKLLAELQQSTPGIQLRQAKA